MEMKKLDRSSKERWHRQRKRLVVKGEKDLYRLVRQTDWAGKEVQHVRVIKAGDGNELTSKESVREKRRKEVSKLGNADEKGKSEGSYEDKDEWKCNWSRWRICGGMEMERGEWPFGPFCLTQSWRVRGSQEELHCVFVGKRKHIKDRMTREELWYCMRK